MASSYTSLLGLVLPVQGELQGTWGDTVNNELTSLLDTAIAGTTTLNTDADVTLTATTGAANQARQQIILWTANGTVTRNITAPAQSKAYVVINKTAGTQSIVIRGVGPTTGVTIAANRAALVAWNGSDFALIATTDASKLSGTLAVANGGTGATTLTANNVILGNGTSAVQFVAPGTTGNILTSNGTTWTSAASTGATLSGNNAFTGANTFYNSTGQTFGTATSTQDGIILAGRAGGSASYRVTLTPTTLTASRTLTLPNVTDTVATIGTAQTFTAAQTFRAANAVRSEAASTQDAVVLAGRAGGTSSYAVTLTPTTLSASRTVTLPDANTTIPVATQVITFSGPTAARTYTLPDAASTLAALATTQTFTALQTFSGSTSVAALKLTNAKEVATVSATAATGTINYDVTTQSVLYYTSNASANWTTNFRGSSGTSLDTLMSTGESITVAFLVTQGTTAYYNNVVQVDGTTSGVTTRWVGGAPTAGNASGIDSYRYLIIKTGSAAFTVLASLTQFKA